MATATKIKNKSGPIPKEQRDEIKKIFLENMAATMRIAASAKAAGISHVTAWMWLNNGYITEQELDICRKTYEELLRGLIDALFYVKQGRTCYPLKDFDYADSRQLWRLAKSHLPEFGGRQPYHEQYDTRGWTPEEKRQVRMLISHIQHGHGRYL